MDQHLGASITLSFGLVAVFAIALYQPDPTTQPGAGPEVTAGNVKAEAEVKTQCPEPTQSAPLPALTAGEPLTAPPAVQATAPDATSPRPAAIAESRAETVASVPPQSARKAPAPRTVPVLPPCEGFTQAREGETLRDVAARVCGSADEAESLWRLNRDLIRGKDHVLPAGTVLRTP